MLGKYFILEIPEAGLHFVAWLQKKEQMPVITRVCSEIGIRPSPLSSCFMKVEPKPALTFGFAAWSRAQIREGLAKFAAALNSKLRKRKGHWDSSREISRGYFALKRAISLVLQREVCSRGVDPFLSRGIATIFFSPKGQRLSFISVRFNPPTPPTGQNEP